MTAGSTHSSPALHRQPPAAERARTIAARPTASLYGLGLGICQLWGATTTEAGDVLLVVPTDGAVTAALRSSPLGDVPARLTVTDRTPVPSRTPSVAWCSCPAGSSRSPSTTSRGWCSSSPTPSRATASSTWACSATLLRLELAEVQLEEAGGTTDVDPDDFLTARPDAVSLAENDLMTEHCEALIRLATRVQRRVGRSDHVRLLGLDRFGVRYRVQSRSGCYDLRVPFAAPLDGRTGFSAAVDRLLTCGAP